MDDLITVFIDLSTKGFKKGSAEVKQAINSLGRAAQKMGRDMAKSSRDSVNMIKRLTRSVKSLIPMIIGVSSAYSVISKAVNAFMSQNEELSSKMNSIWTALGNVLAPILTQIIDWVTTAVSYFLEFLRILGVTGKSASQLSQKANKSTKELQKTIAGFDELNILQDNQQENKDRNLDDVEATDWMKNLAAWFKDLLDLLKNQEWDAAADKVIEALNKLIYAFRDKAEEWGQIAGEWLQGITHFVARVLDETDWKQLGVGIANFLNGLLKDVDGLNFGEDLGKILAAKFTIAFKILTGFLETIKGEQIGKIASELVKSFFDSLTRAINEANPAAIGQNIADFFNNIDWDGIGISIGNFLEEAWTFAFTLLHNLLTGVDWVDIGSGIRAFFQNINWDVIGIQIFVLLQDAWNAAWNLLLGLLGKGSDSEPPVIKDLEKLKTAIEEFGKTVLQILEPVFEVLKKVFEWKIESSLPREIEEVTRRIESFTQALKGIIGIFEAFAKLLQGDFKGALEAAKRGFGDLKDAPPLVETPVQKLTEKIKELIREKLGLKEKADEVTAALEKEGNAADTASGKLSAHSTTSDTAAKANANLTAETDNATEAVHRFAGAQGELDAAGSALIQTLLEQGYNLQDIATALGISTEEVMRQAGQETELTGATQNATVAGDELANATTTVGEEAQKAVTPMQELGNAASQAGQQFNEATVAMREDFAIELEELKLNIQTQVEEIKLIISESMETIRLDIETKMTELKDFITLTLDTFKEDLTLRIEELKVLIPETFTEIQAQFEEGFNNIRQSMEDNFQKAKESAVKLSDEVRDEVATRYEEMEQRVEQTMMTLQESLASTWDSIKENTSSTMTDIRQNVTEAFNNIAQTVNTKMRETYNTMQNSWEQIKNKVNTTLNEICNRVNDSFNRMSNQISNMMDQIRNKIDSSWNEILQNTENSMDEMARNIEDAWEEMNRTTENQANELADTCERIFSDLAWSAYGWGFDMMANMASGIYAGIPMVVAAASAAASAVNSVLGFSEPKEGPLSDFHTYGPDMMALYAEGIHKGSSKVIDVVKDVAGAISDEINGGNYSVDNIGGNMSAFNAFGNVPFQMPVVAGGGILPYSVTGGESGSSSFGADMTDALNRLFEKLDSMQNTFENMQFVAEFGNIRAVAKEIRKVTRQIERAEGV